MPTFIGDDAFNVLKFDMADPADRAECGGFMSALANSRPCVESRLHSDQCWMVQERAKLRRALSRQPSPNAHLIGQAVPRGLLVEQYAAVIEQYVFDRKWQEARDICRELRSIRRRMAADRARLRNMQGERC